MEGWMERYRAVLLAVCVVAALAGLTVYELRHPEPVPLLPASLPAVALTAEAPTPGPVRVYVTGAVLDPGVVTVPAGSIVEDAVAAAGGASGEADLERINLAQSVQDGSRVYVPRLGEGVPQSSPADPARVNVNTADAAALDTLPGIGPELAARIIGYRQEHGPFAEEEDLLDVPGIGPSILANIRDLITTK
jgi:competence protein ComEA